MNHESLYQGITKAAWGYFFIYFNININGINILPSFVGYMLFLSAIGYLEQEERELSLLRTINVLLILWHIASWFISLFAVSLDGMIPFIDIIVCLINLYFHFQLLTNLASIAAKYQQENDELSDKLLRYRTVQTVLLTIVTVLDLLSDTLAEIWILISVGLVIVYLIIGVCLMKALFDLRRSLTETTI
jgi:hypothetical protein